MTFKYNYLGSKNRGGFTWYCQRPKYHWATDPILGWELLFSNPSDGPPTWWLVGHGITVNMEAKELLYVMLAAGDAIREYENGQVARRSGQGRDASSA